MPDVLMEKKENGVALITLNRPESLNAMGGNLLPMLADYVSECSKDDAVRCVVLTGAGRAFCAGGDVKAMAGRPAEGSGQGGAVPQSMGSGIYAGIANLRDLQRRSSLALHTMPKPTIAMVNGHAVGAGFSLALACDLRVASEKAKLGTVFRNVALSGDFGSSYFLPRLVGSEKARELFFTGAILTAEEAKQIGMVSRVVPHDQLMEKTMELAVEIASGPTLTLGKMKENLNLSASSNLETLLDQEAMNQRITGMTNDHREAVKAFVEKRKPTFSGQ